MLIHIYKFTDTPLNYYSDQNVAGSRRELLSIVYGFSVYFDLPWINDLLYIIFVATTAVVIAQLFDIQGSEESLIASGLLVLFLATTETFLFGFTADGYVLVTGSVIVLSLGIMGCYISKIYEEIKGRPCFIISEEFGEENEEDIR